MIRLVSFLLAILIGIYLTLSIVNSKDEYSAERLIWKANQNFNKIAQDPEAVPSKTYQEVEGAYQKIIQHFPDAIVTKEAYLNLSRLHLVKKNSQKAREVVKSALTKYPKAEGFLAEALSLVGKSYESSYDWPNALKTYNDIINRYPLTETGLKLPLYIANFYLIDKKSADANNAFEMANDHYKKLITEHRGRPHEISLLATLANSYLFQKSWKNAVDTLGALLSQSATQKVLTPQRATMIAQIINNISITKLNNNYDLPTTIYSNFIQQHPRHQLNPILQKMIAAFETLKSKNVEIKK